MTDLLNRTPTEVIGAHIRSAPVDVYAIAGELGLAVHEEPLPENISGKIEKGHLFGYAVTINQAHSKTRRRFTLAHEIAHFVLHRDMIGDSIVDDGLYRSDRGDAIERQANAYAASILMPAPLVREKFGAGMLSYAAMSAIFDVSTEVARIRMRELAL